MPPSDPLETTPTGFLGYWTLRIKRATAQLPLFPRAIHLVWSAAHRWTVAWAVLLLASGVLPVALVYLTRALVNAVLAAMRPGGPVRPALTYAALMAAVLLAVEALRAL